MKILILGGTGFVGPHIVNAARQAGMTVTLFNRGKSTSAVNEDVERLLGDRDLTRGDGLAALTGRTWDAAIDLCGYVPRLVGASAAALAGAVGQYIFVSSISVYSDLSLADITESSPVGTMADPGVETINGETYGPLKVLCEQAAEAAMPGRVTCLRPGLIVGPGDSTDRFTYWPARISRGGKVLAPGEPADPVQFIDVRDLAEFTIGVVQHRIFGTMNVVGQPLPMGEFLERCCKVISSDAQLCWASTEFLTAKEVRPWMDIPLWIPDSPTMRGFARVNHRRAIAAGLELRSIETTIAETLEWYRNERPSLPLRAGLSDERERELLKGLSIRGSATTRSVVGVSPCD